MMVTVLILTVMVMLVNCDISLLVFDIYNSFGVNPMTFTYEPLSWSGSKTLLLKVMIKSSLFCSPGMFATHSYGDGDGEDGDDGDVGEDDEDDHGDGEDGDHISTAACFAV